MGMYINAPEMGNSFAEKVQFLKDKHQATETTATMQPNLVCVVDNGMFAAAAYCYSQGEFEEFNSTSRPKTWLIVPNAKELAQ